MDVKVSIGDKDIKEEVKKDEMDSLEEEEIWRIRRERIKNALTAARAAARQEPADLYAAASRLVDVIKRADVEEFISEIERLADQTDPSATIIFQGLPRGSLLHIAVLEGKGDILRLLLDNVHDHFVATQDDWGNTPLHIATKAKEIKFIDMLIGRVKDLPNVEDKLLLRIKNKHGNTALHEAVLTCDVDLVKRLLGEDPEPVYLKNEDQKSPLYLALETRNQEIFPILFSLPLDPSRIEGLPPVHGAVAHAQYESLKILKTNMKLFAMRDSGGGNVFHLAAFWNVPQVFELLQPETKYLAREQDNNGDLPIHIASKGGHVALIKKLYPVSQWVNGQGQTILHIAAKYGRENVVRYILRHPDLGEMINERDHDGNTPSHLAAKYLQPAALLNLVVDKRMKPSLLNHKNLSVVDSAPDHPRHGFRPGWARILLLSVSAKRPDLLILKPEARDKAEETLASVVNLSRMREDINTLLLVATLVTTVTFAAGFAVPGGLNSSDMASKDDRGMATMLDNRMFQHFVIYNTIAMFCSMTSVVCFMFAYLSEVHVSIFACLTAYVLLACSLPAMSAAFLIGVTLTVGKLSWLATKISLCGHIFIVIITGALSSPVVNALGVSVFLLPCLRPIRPLMSLFILACFKFLNVETTIISDDAKEDRTGSKTSAGPPLGGGGEDC
ncbi:protein ACCELERATED CELL DEATH 6-like [Eucalyptus grandis]|uniref:protein ACCELERATED CELL DEATH 6-like n=1 Tax=Eucalyptus grandis TaxID=71139 RepID=UPI00192EFB2F|nr:protein ACCELERATED CELL DEATH 6-like [Eucalyptus grandis]